MEKNNTVNEHFNDKCINGYTFLESFRLKTSSTLQNNIIDVLTNLGSRSVHYVLSRIYYKYMNIYYTDTKTIT